MVPFSFLVVPSYFYPRPPRGGRLAKAVSWIGGIIFLSTPSARRATTCKFFQLARIVIFLSTPSARRATHNFSGLLLVAILFLSTPSARRATILGYTMACFALNFYPRPPRGGRRHNAVRQGLHPLISIHALREEGDSMRQASAFCNAYFYPRPPRGGRPDALPVELTQRKNFYPRPPRGGRPVAGACGSIGMHFYPRPPRGGRRFFITNLLYYALFLSTPSARRAT